MLLRADQDGRLRGVAGVASNGDIATWAIDESDGGDSVAHALLQACAKEAAALGAPELRIYMPPASVPGERALFEMGFRPITPSFITLRVVHFPSLLEALARGSTDRVARFAPFRLHVHLTPGRYPELAHQDMEIVIDPAAASVLPGHAVTADARVEMSATTLTELLFGADGGAALRDPALVRVTPPERTGTVHAIMEALAVPGGWYTPIGDRR